VPISGEVYEAASDDLRLDSNAGTCLPRLATRAIEAALAETTDARARVLVGIASELRRAGRPDVALRALDAAWELCPTDEPRRAAFTCAIEAHCDLGQFEVAETIEREQAERSVDERFARAALRLYSALSRITDLDIHYARRAHYVALLNGRELSAAGD
jgi:hypothetical protein